MEPTCLPQAGGAGPARLSTRSSSAWSSKTPRPATSVRWSESNMAASTWKTATGRPAGFRWAPGIYSTACR